MDIFIRPATLDDGHLIVKWRNSPSVSMHCFNRNPVTLESNEEFYHRYVETGSYQQYIVERFDDFTGVVRYPIATIYLKDIDKHNKRCQLCIFTSNDEEWNTESQQIAIRKLLYIAFEELDMHKVYSYVFSKFDDERELLENSGFKKEALLKKEAIGSDGSYYDVYRMTICDDEYESINVKK